MNKFKVGDKCSFGEDVFTIKDIFDEHPINPNEWGNTQWCTSVECVEFDLYCLDDITLIEPLVNFGEVKIASSGGGLRYNTGKAQIHQVPTSLINGVAKVLMYGAQKYEKGNFRKGMDWTTPYDCLQRHMMRWLDGEQLDEESNLPHLYHAAANIAMLIEYSETCKELDDRFTGEKNEYSTSFESHDFNSIKKQDDKLETK